MSFGGLNPFSSSSSSSSSPSNSAPQPPTPPQTSPSTSSAMKTELISRIQSVNTVANARFLIMKINENCFNHCIPVPSSSLSSKEQTCLSTCMEKYIDAWNTVNRTYIARLQREGAEHGGAGGGGGGGVGGGLLDV